MIAAIRKTSISVSCPIDMEMYRFVTVNFVTGVAAYTSAGATPNGVTITRACLDAGGTTATIEVVPIQWITGTHHIDFEETLIAGDAIKVGTDGKAKKLTGSATPEKWTIEFSTDLIAANSTLVTIDGASITPVVFATDHATTMAAIVAAILAKTVWQITACAIVAGTSNLKLEFTSALALQDVRCVVSAGVSQPNTMVQNYPARANNLDSGFIVYNGAKVGEVGSVFKV